MKENLTLQRTAILSEDAINNHLSKLNIKVNLDKHDYHLLSLGMQTGVIGNIQLNNQVFEGRIRVRYNENKGKFEYNIDTKKYKLEIPEKELNVILKRKLNENEISDLHAGKKIGPFKNNSSEFFVAVDKELNKVTVYSNKYLGIPNQYAGYNFNPQEKQQLANGLPIGPKVFRLDKNTYVLGSFSINPSLTEYSQNLEIFKELSKKQAEEYAQKYNQNTVLQTNNKLPLIQEPESKNLQTSTENKTIANTLAPTKVYNNYNKTFNFYHFTSDKNDSKFNEMLQKTFTSSELDTLKSGKNLNKTMVHPKTGKTFSFNAQLIEQNNRYILIFHEPKIEQKAIQEKTIQNENNTGITRYFSEQDKLVLNLIDKKDFKEINNMVKNGYKPSEDIQNLIINSNILSLKDKLTAAHTLQFNENKLVAIHRNNLPKALQKDADNKLPGDSKIKNKDDKLVPPTVDLSKTKDADKKKDKQQEKQKHSGGEKRRDMINLLKNTFGDM